MIRVSVLALLAGAPVAIPAAKADDPPRIKVRSDLTVEKILAALHGQKVTYEKNLADTPLFEILQDLAKRHDMTFIIMEERFNAAGLAGIRDAKPTFSATRIEGLTLSRFLNLVLTDMGAVCLVRPDYLEITTREAALKEVGLTEAGAEARLNLPLVSLAATDRPLADVFADLARSYGLNVVIDPAARQAMKDVKVTEQLLNVPADTALELLAGQAGLMSVRKGNAFLVTSIDHANALAVEEFQREMRKIELQKLKNPPPPALPGGQVPNGLIPFGPWGVPIPGGNK
jgi:hypothetical protein